jgi:hypothetical protein
MREWEVGDRAREEHLKHNPLCPFLNGYGCDIPIGHEDFQRMEPSPAVAQKKLEKSKILYEIYIIC